MPHLTYQVTMPGGDNGGHSESEWIEGDDLVNIKVFDTYYECHWYTDIERQDFLAFFENRNQHRQSGDSKWCVVRTITHDHNEETDIQIGDLVEKSDLTEYELIEVELDQTRSYWKKEQVPRPGLEDLEHRIHVSGPPDSVEPLLDLYPQFAPERMDESTSVALINAVTEYIKENAD